MVGTLTYQEFLNLTLSIVVALILLYTAALARRSAKAAELAAGGARDAAEAAKQSAQAALGMLSLEADREEEAWIERLSYAFPDPTQVAAVLRSLPVSIAGRWETLAEVAAERNPNMRPVWKKHLAMYRGMWEEAALHREARED